jgi:colicin import membrane protein
MDTALLPTPYIEGNADRFKAFLWSLLVHGLAVFLELAGVLVSSEPEQTVLAGEPIEAVIIDLPAAPAPRPTRPSPQVQQAQVPIAPPPKPEPSSSLDNVTDIKPVISETPDPLAAQAEEEKKRRLKQEEESRRQLDELRKKREQAEIERIKAEEALKTKQEQSMEEMLKTRTGTATRETDRIAEEEAALRGNNDTDDLLAQWQSAVVSQIRDHWRINTNTPDGLRCRVRINMLPGGDVGSRMVLSPCAFDEVLRQSLLDAIDAASPLPSSGFESVFQKQLTLDVDTTFDR